MIGINYVEYQNNIVNYSWSDHLELRSGCNSIAHVPLWYKSVFDLI